VLAVLARHGPSGVSMRAVAREAGVALGLATYYFSDKTTLVAAALDRLGTQDALMLEADQAADPVTQLRQALRRVADHEFLATDYLALRLQLWALAPVHPTFARINHEAQRRYRDRLADLISRARPGLTEAAAAQRAADILIVQNGIWLTSLLIADRDATDRAVRRCEQIALDDTG
jgi:AcrR family transcriptional regulator